MGMIDYSIPMNPGRPGDISSGLPFRVKTKINPTNNVLPYGRAVVQGTETRDVLLPTSSNTAFVGITVNSSLYEKAVTSNGEQGYPAQSVIDVLSSGEIWVEVEEAVAPGDPVYFRHTATTSNPKVGVFRKSADGTNAALISQARWITKTTGPGVAILEINIP